MCHFITIGVRKRHFEAAQGLVPRGFQAFLATNPFVLRTLPADFKTFLLVSGGCSCGLYRRPGSTPARVPDTERLRKKYEKLGWSAGKIERAIEQAESSHVDPEHFCGYRADVCEVITEIVGIASSVAVLVHFYDGLVDNESIEFGEPQRIHIEQLREIEPEEDRWLWLRG